jgi:hypothetical protein
MPLSIQHRHAVVFAGRTHDVGVITTVVSEVLVASPGTNLSEIEQVFRDSNSAAYLVATTEGFVSCSVRWQCWWRSAKRA